MRLYAREESGGWIRGEGSKEETLKEMGGWEWRITEAVQMRN